VRKIGHFIDGAVTGGNGTEADVFNPATGEVCARVAMGGSAELETVIASARAAQPAWAATNPQRRARVLMKFVALVNENLKPLAELMSLEHGKTVADSMGDLQRGIDVAEFAIGIPHLAKGEFSVGAGPALDMYSMHQPIGIGAGISPFNFPAMIPLWMSMPAIACGNAFIMKPSERDPSVPMRLAELLIEAGLPKGIFNVLNGGKDAVDAILAHPDIGAISFVGSTPIAAHVYATAAANGKRVQSFGGAKNHAIVMPDADMNMVADGLIGAAYGSAGERCMAISVAVPVGEGTAEKMMEVLRPRVEALKVGPYTDSDADFGPVVTAAAQAKIKSLVDSGVTEGADLVVDGRKFSLQGYENGFYVGPCLFDNVTPDMEIYKQEIFGPVLAVVRAKTADDALALVNKHEYGNGVCIFTRDGDAARTFSRQVQIGMVGVNVPIPTPLAYFGFGGWKRSVFGDLNQHGPDSIRFWTRTKTVTERWPSSIQRGAEFSMPVFSANK
jgi:malonate-semialdehyde dehydrogenase (acetylating)/methylmalonate-semialdehyde dehydrogenase